MINLHQEIEASQFDQLVKEYEGNFLFTQRYYERLAIHRHPVQVKQETIQDLYSRIRQIQSRPEMRDIDPIKNALGYATTVINDIFSADKRLRLYGAVQCYCRLRGKAINEIAPHIVEYRAVNILAKKISRSLRPLKVNMPQAPSDGISSTVLDHLLSYGKKLEQSLRLSRPLKEETCRDHFIAHLSSVSRDFSAKAETFNRNGRTDILVSDTRGNTLLIAECKLWKGQVHLTQAVNQLLGNYVSWRDEQVAIILFNKDRKDFFVIADKADDTLRNHPCFIKTIGPGRDTFFSYSFRHPTDTAKTIQLHLILFNFA
jgi:hypothetical protein